ncbi:MAG: NAD-dependent epimerase/dehydratase family protein [Candidatus Zixiibacteriota bacterium]|nr:MAG: NAD-dependent epimerase/dehydratase family protein [candidate division Zixibacteria bacterium]
MEILIIGGTRFLGRHLVETAVRQGHEVTLFNRGKTNPELFSELEQLHGDRDSDLALLENRSWDTVIDTCGYFPRIVRKSAELLANAVRHYVFVSTIAVYKDSHVIGLDETAEVATTEDETIEEITGQSYGALKALCEQAVEDALPGRTLVVRPGLIVGPHDPSDRFTYWVQRIARGGEILAPEPKDLQTQLIDARDLAAWIVNMVETGQTGVYHATGPKDRLTMQKLFQAINNTCNRKASLVWMPEKFLLDHDVEPWIELPMWLIEERGMMATNVAKVFSAGLICRPLEETIRDTLEWHESRPGEMEYKISGMKPEREAELLRAWHESDRS